MGLIVASLKLLRRRMWGWGGVDPIGPLSTPMNPGVHRLLADEARPAQERAEVVPKASDSEQGKCLVILGLRSRLLGVQCTCLFQILSYTVVPLLYERAGGASGPPFQDSFPWAGGIAFTQRHLGALRPGKPGTARQPLQMRTELGHLRGVSKKDFWVVVSLWTGGYACGLGPTYTPQAQITPGSLLWAGGAPIARAGPMQGNVSSSLVQGKYLERRCHKSSLVWVRDSCLFQAFIYTDSHVSTEVCWVWGRK